MSKKLVLVLISVIIFSFAQQRDSIVRIGACATPGITWNVFVRDSIAYVADRGYVTTVNVADPANPWVLDSLNSGPPIAAEGIYVQDTVAYCNLIGIGTRFITISVAKPDSLYLLGWCTIPSSGAGDPTGVVLKDTIIYLATSSEGVMQINVSDPSSPDTIKAYDTPGLAMDLAVKDTLVYIVDASSLQIINVADPMNPYYVGSVSMPNICQGIFVRDSFAYATCESSVGTNGSVQVVNVSDPTSPQIVASVNTLNADPVDIWISGNYAYVAAADFWFVTKGIKREAGGLRPEGAFNMGADIEGGLRIVNISDPLNPTLVASYDTPGDPRGVFAVDTLVFIADYDSLQILKHSITGIEEISDKKVIKNFRLQIQPNPFVNSTEICYQLPVSSQVSLEIFDITGRLVIEIIEEYPKAGTYTVVWDGKDGNNREVATGIYICRFTTRSGSLFEKLIITK